jgi:dihydroneopterin aldolase
MQQQMRIENYVIHARLGCEPEERRYPQPVHVTLQLDFDSPLDGAESDNLEGAVDYVELANILKFVAEQKEYRLVEHLNLCLFQNIAAYISSRNIKAVLRLETRKVRVPVENFRDGVVFTCIKQL